LQITTNDAQAAQDSEKHVRNLKLILSYDGSEFAGWQVQPGRATVQGTLAHAIGRLSGENVLPQGSGRTDAGVHALAQVASFVTASPIPIENWALALNDLLPPSIRVLEVTEAAPDFHARKSAHAKTYRYRMHRGPICAPFVARYVWHYPYPLDEAAMAEAAGVMAGEHDFTSFAAVDPERVERMTASEEGESCAIAPTQTVPAEIAHLKLPIVAPAIAPTNVRKIFSAAWIREGDELIYTVRGNGFLHHMVRNLIGTFVLVGKGIVSLEDLRRILAARDRSAAGPTAPASGLFLVSVEY
jgi:tRNA pseudouridine38-40 synthase